VKFKSKNLQPPDIFINGKFALGWETALFAEMQIRTRDDWDVSKYTLQVERKEYMAELTLG